MPRYHVKYYKQSVHPICWGEMIEARLHEQIIGFIFIIHSKNETHYLRENSQKRGDGMKNEIMKLYTCQLKVEH